ncbi:MAG TPA: GNAT family N-acetyltransferase [Clostridiales bacterium]|nr:GNAT family N-acetyltransferase [Clostridiales bacterium]
MNLVIRKALPEDIPAIHQITQEAFKKYAQDLGLPHTVSALKETEETIRQDMERKTILIALLDDMPVGSIRYEILPGNIAYISRFGVKLDIQKSGVGRALMEAAEEDLRKQGVAFITLHTATKMTAQVRFYYGLGFYVHSTTTDRGYIRGLFCKELTEVDSKASLLVNIK